MIQFQETVLTNRQIDRQKNIWKDGCTEKPTQIEGHMEGRMHRKILFYRTLPATDRGPKNIMIEMIYWVVLQHMNKSFKEILQAPVFKLIFDVILRKTMK